MERLLHLKLQKRTALMKFTGDFSMRETDRKRSETDINAERLETTQDDSGLTEMFDFLGIERKYYRETFDLITASAKIFEQTYSRSFWVHDDQQTIVCANSHFLDQYGNCNKRQCYEKLMGEDNVCGCCQSRKAFRSDAPQHCNLCHRKKSGCDINTFHVPITNLYGDRFILKSSFHIDYSAAISAEVFMKGQAEHSDHKLLVSCSACHRIKDREGHWVRIAQEILDHYSGRISHGICPECITLLYPDLLDLPIYTDKKLKS